MAQGKENGGKTMKFYHLILALLIFSAISWFLIVKGFNLAIIWLVEGGFYRFMNNWDVLADKIYPGIALAVGVAIAGFFVFSVILGWWGHRREVKKENNGIGN